MDRDSQAPLPQHGLWAEQESQWMQQQEVIQANQAGQPGSAAVSHTQQPTLFMQSSLQPQLQQAGGQTGLPALQGTITPLLHQLYGQPAHHALPLQSHPLPAGLAQPQPIALTPEAVASLAWLRHAAAQERAAAQPNPHPPFALNQALQYSAPSAPMQRAYPSTPAIVNISMPLAQGAMQLPVSAALAAGVLSTQLPQQATMGSLLAPLMVGSQMQQVPQLMPQPMMPLAPQPQLATPVLLQSMAIPSAPHALQVVNTAPSAASAAKPAVQTSAQSAALSAATPTVQQASQQQADVQLESDNESDDEFTSADSDWVDPQWRSRVPERNWKAPPPAAPKHHALTPQGLRTMINPGIVRTSGLTGQVIPLSYSIFNSGALPGMLVMASFGRQVFEDTYVRAYEVELMQTDGVQLNDGSCYTVLLSKSGFDFTDDPMLALEYLNKCKKEMREVTTAALMLSDHDSLFAPQVSAAGQVPGSYVMHMLLRTNEKQMPFEWYLDTRPGRKVDMGRARYYVQEVVKLFRYATSHGILARFTGAMNFGISWDPVSGRPKLMLLYPFSPRKMTNPEGLAAETIYKNKQYMPPETGQQSGYGVNILSWTVVCILYYLVTGRWPLSLEDIELLYPELRESYRAGQLKTLLNKTIASLHTNPEEYISRISNLADHEMNDEDALDLAKLAWKVNASEREGLDELQHICKFLQPMTSQELPDFSEEKELLQNF